MKRILWFLIGSALLCSPWMCGQSFTLNHVETAAWKTSSSAAAPTYLFDEGYEANPGYDTSGTWTESGTHDPDHSTAGLSLNGSECLELDSTGGTDAYVISPTFASAYSSVYGYTKFRMDQMPDNTARTHFVLRTNTTAMLTITVNSNGVIGLQHGSSGSVNLTARFTNGVTYHMWFDYASGSGTNGTASIAFSTDGTRPVSGSSYYTNITAGNGTSSINNLRLYSDQNAAVGHVVYFDRTLLDDVQIGDSP